MRASPLEFVLTQDTRINLAPVFFATLCTIATIYAPQPLLPLLALRFQLSETTAALAVTMTMLPLALAPVAYGLLLESLPAAKLARWAVLAVGFGHLGVVLAPDWEWLLLARLFQGLAIPAALTSVMTLLAVSSAPERMRRVMSWYIATTILGGFCGRFFSGLLAEYWNWRAPFAVLGLLLVAAFVLLGPLSHGRAPGFTRPRLAHVRQALSQPAFLRAYALIFCCFFTFSALLNYLPFRLAELEGAVSPARAGYMYLSYLVGIGTCLTAPRLVPRLGGEGRAFLVGQAMLVLALAVCLFPDVPVLFGAMFPLCAGFFLVQTVGPVFVNSRAGEHKGLVNGLYISFYYGGGACGSFLPGLVYRAFGWSAFLICLLAVLGVAVFLATRLLRVD